MQEDFNTNSKKLRVRKQSRPYLFHIGAGKGLKLVEIYIYENARSVNGVKMKAEIATMTKRGIERPNRHIICLILPPIRVVKISSP